MGIKKYSAYTPSRRHMTAAGFQGNHQGYPREIPGGVPGQERWS